MGTEVLPNKLGNSFMLSEVRVLENAEAVFNRRFGHVDEFYGSRKRISRFTTRQNDEAAQSAGLFKATETAKSQLCRLFQSGSKYYVRITVALDVTIAREKCPLDSDLPFALRL